MEEEAVRRGAQIWGNKTWKCDSFCLFATVFCLFLLSFVWLSFFDSGRKMLAEEQQCWRKKLWTWTEIPSLLFTSLLGTKNNSTNCLFSASLPMLYCITGANFLFSLCTVLVSIHRTWHNYVHNDFCTQSDFFFFFMGLRKLVRAFSFPWDRAKACDAKGDSHGEAAAQKYSAVQCGVMRFSTLLFGLTPFSCLTLLTVVQ